MTINPEDRAEIGDWKWEHPVWSVLFFWSKETLSHLWLILRANELDSLLLRSNATAMKQLNDWDARYTEDIHSIPWIFRAIAITSLLSTAIPNKAVTQSLCKQTDLTLGSYNNCFDNGPFASFKYKHWLWLTHEYTIRRRGEPTDLPHWTNKSYAEASSDSLSKFALSS